MKRTAVTLLVSLTLCSLKVKAQRVSFTGKPVQLASFFSSVSKQTGYTFFYNSGLIRNIPPLIIELKNISLDSAMHAVLKNLPVTYLIQGKTIFISPVTISSPKISTSNVPVLQKIIGRVVDSSGIPIIGASISELKGKTSVISNENGDFQIRISTTDSLMVSCIGYGKTVAKPDSNFLVIVLPYSSSPLEQVVVGGNLFAIKRKSDISSLSIINSKTLATLPVTDIAEIYRGLVPGTNSFSVGDQTQNSPTLSIRGAAGESSISQISVVVDGVEWADGSGYLSALNKENIDRIEILRGPESSTLYGTGSNGGIVQIYTKKATPNTDDFSATTAAGLIQSKWVPASAFQQYYTLDKNIGFKNTGLLAGGTYQINGPWLPGGGEKTGTGHISLKWDPGNKISVNFTGYYAGTNRNVSRDPAYDTCIHIPDSLQYLGVSPTKLTNKKTEIRSYFAGLNLLYQANLRWTHHLTLGFSQNEDHESPLAIINKNGLAPDNFAQSVGKTSILRYSNIFNLGDPDKTWATSVTSGADLKNIYYEQKVVGTNGYVENNDPSNTNLGIFTQINSSYKNVFLTAGLRYDYNKLFGDNHSLNPRIGLTTNFSLTGLTFKPRISWGSGITAPSYSARYGYPSDGNSIGTPNPAIKPQQQSGFDYGLEIYDRQSRLSGEIVYYDNSLKNMFVINTLPPEANGLNVYQTTNAGLIKNRGWEFSATCKLNKRLSLYGSFSIMCSVVKDSTGDYLSAQLAGKAPGYQLTNLPRHTAGLFSTYHFFKLFGKNDPGSLSVNVTEVDGVYALNGVQWLIDLAYGRTPITSQIPNRYWQTNGTIFKLGFNFEYYILGGIRFFAQGSNILNQNEYELDSNFPTHGANWLFGLKFSIQN
jgi:outer membrane receptor protein involved in Fe transport